MDEITIYLVGGFNPSEKYSSNWIISPNRGENKKYLKPPPRYPFISRSGCKSRRYRLQTNLLTVDHEGQQTLDIQGHRN